MSLISSKLTASERTALKNKILLGVENKEKENRDKVITYGPITIKDVENVYTDRYARGNYPINYLS